MNTPAEAFARPWLTLARLDEDEGYWDAWLSLLVQGAGGDVMEAVLVWGEAGIYRPLAFRPAGQACGEDLAALCEQALALRLPASRPGRPGLLAMPILVGDDLAGVVALKLREGLPAGLQDWLRWGMGWLVCRRVREEGGARESLRERLMTTLDLLMLALGEEKAASACQAVATEAAVRLGCERVAIGFGRMGGGVRLAALSHSADFSRHLDLAHSLEAAMDEAVDQGGDVAYPGRDAGPGGSLVIDREHRALASRFGGSFILTVPFVPADGHEGAFLFEWGEGDTCSADTEHLAVTLPPILGRVLQGKRFQERALHERLRDRVRQEADRLLGPRHAMRKLVAAACLLFVAFCLFATGDFRVSANAQLEGGVRRQIVAPFDGYVAGAEARAGQVVKAGAVLATLDDRDLRLETSRWTSQQSQYANQMSDAAAQHNLAQVQIALAQTNQAAAQRELSESMQERARVVAPFAGIIVSGDLSQNLGGAVKKGQALFEIAPLDSYRIVLQVDESDIAWVQVGRKGSLMLTALPGEEIPFTVTLVTSVAQASEGRNHFRVEASLERPFPRLRPGMDGVGKISVQEARLIWIWTRHMTDWLRLQAWSWLGV